MDAKPGHFSWDDLQLLYAVARAGSFLAAGRELGLATSTLSRRLTRLEASLGAPLVERRSDGVRLTPAGRRLYALAEDVELRMRAGLRDLGAGAGELRGTIRVTAGEGFTDVLVGAIAGFHERHPRVSFELAVDGRPHDLARREADLALRTWRGDEKTLVYVAIARVAYGLFAARSYLQRRGAPRSGRELAEHDFIGFAPPQDQLSTMRWLRGIGASRFALKTTGLSSMLLGARAGLGIVPLPEPLSDGLERVLPSLRSESGPVYLVTHPEARRLAHVRAFGRALTEHVRALSGSAAKLGA